MSDPVNIPDFQVRLAGLVAARDAIDREIALLAGGDDSAPGPMVVKSEWGSLKDAMKLCGIRDRKTMLSKVKAHGLGRKIDRVWRIEMTKLREWLKAQTTHKTTPQDSLSTPQHSVEAD